MTSFKHMVMYFYFIYLPFFLAFFSIENEFSSFWVKLESSTQRYQHLKGMIKIPSKILLGLATLWWLNALEISRHAHHLLNLQMKNTNKWTNYSGVDLLAHVHYKFYKDRGYLSEENEQKRDVFVVSSLLFNRYYR